MTSAALGLIQAAALIDVAAQAGCDGGQWHAGQVSGDCLDGLLILLAPYVARSADVRELMGQAALVGWFALVLGIAFMVQYGLRRAQAGRRQP